MVLLTEPLEDDPRRPQLPTSIFIDVQPAPGSSLPPGQSRFQHTYLPPPRVPPIPQPPPGQPLKWARTTISLGVCLPDPPPPPLPPTPAGEEYSSVLLITEGVGIERVKAILEIILEKALERRSAVQPEVRLVWVLRPSSASFPFSIAFGTKELTQPFIAIAASAEESIDELRTTADAASLDLHVDLLAPPPEPSSIPGRKGSSTMDSPKQLATPTLRALRQLLGCPPPAHPSIPASPIWPGS